MQLSGGPFFACCVVRLSMSELEDRANINLASNQQLVTFRGGMTFVV